MFRMLRQHAGMDGDAAWLEHAVTAVAHVEHCINPAARIVLVARGLYAFQENAVPPLDV